MLFRRAVAALESRNQATAGLPFGNSQPPTNGMLGGMFGGTPVNEHTAMQLAAVYGSVDLISAAIASLPVKQYREARGGQLMEMPLAPVIAQPWSEITRRDFVTQGTASLLLRGNLYGRIVSRDADGFPEQVQLIHPDHARVRRNSNGNLEVEYFGKLVPPTQVTRAMALSVPESLVGISPVENLRNSLGLARAQDLYAGAFFANSARPDGWIGVDDDLDPDETTAMIKSWMAAHQGLSQAHLPAILTGGAKWNAITMSMGDAQFLEQMQYSASVISGMIYRVPPHMIGMVDRSTSWGNGIEQQELGFVRNTLLIWLNRWEDLFDSWLPDGQRVKFDLSDRLRGDTLQRFSAYQIARVAGWMSNLDVMRSEGMELPTDPELLAQLADYNAPLNSAPVKPTSTGGAGGDKSD